VTKAIVKKLNEAGMAKLLDDVPTAYEKIRSYLFFLYKGRTMSLR